MSNTPEYLDEKLTEMRSKEPKKWEPINNWALVDKDVNIILARLPACFKAAKTISSIKRLLSLNEEMYRICGFSWSDIAHKETNNV